MKIRILLTTILSMFFLLSEAQVNVVSIIGSATPGGWEADTDMTQDPTDTSIWTINIDLGEGEVKFRANNEWVIDWGSTDFPNGVGTQGGANIPVIAGNYDVTFNHTSGVYSFSFDSPIGIIGSATPGDWAEDTDMFHDETSGLFYITMDLIAGDAKFRKDNDWIVDWGASDFPSGIGTQGGDNIPIPNAGTYYITLDTASGAYNFVEQVSYETIGIIGDATPGGWEEDTDMTKDANDPDKWSIFIELTDGGAKFRADDVWTTAEWGGDDFPTGIGTQGAGNIPVVAGYYRVDLNSETGEYSFTEVGNYDVISIIGDATPGGWEADTDMIQDENDPTIWRVAMELTDGEAKFRANNEWVMDWGGSEFPIGVAVPFGANIPIEAGEYNVTFNTLTGEYNFEVFVVYDQVSLVGKDGPFGEWPATDDGGAVDAYMTIDPDDNQLWTLAGAALTTADTTLTDSGVKFRADTDWAVNWGAIDFPGGTATQDGANIRSVEGIYNVSFNTETGEYLFSDPSGTEEILSPSAVKVYPNPTSNTLNVNIQELDVIGEAMMTIYDMQGKVLKKKMLQLTDNISVDVSALNAGNYLLNISNGEFTVGKRFAVAK